MNKQQQTLFGFCKVLLNDNGIVTYQDIITAIDTTAPIIVDLCDDDKVRVIQELESFYAITVNDSQMISKNYTEEKWYTKIKNEIEHEHWDAYKTYLIDEKNFNPNIVSQLGDETLDYKLMNSLGNPNDDSNFLKRGLVIGDVQSGKTSTYIGLMCKAADAGYKAFIMLTGTVESLRSQTQERVEEGFIGIDITKGKPVGVGKNKENKVTSLTSRISDFNGNKDQNFINFSTPTVLVVKKNATNLKKLKNWLIKVGARSAPLLMIDDESDNASINTNAEKEDPTTINKSIREILDSFDKANYVGFTATPFANVFIDPTYDEDMENQDLFPEDFIVTLSPPSNYIGANSIYLDNSKYKDQLRYIEDAGHTIDDGFDFYSKHKKEWAGELPESLTDAIYAFYIVNAIRDINGDKETHRSMLINISRFTDVQKYTKSNVESIHTKAYAAIKYDLHEYKIPYENNKILKRIYSIWQKEYSNLSISWSEVSLAIFKSIEDIKIKVINSDKSSDKLEYTGSNSVRVIAIGGLALSRGLTLEGLIISYFYRNTSTYDVLMQMGRWFGYRNGYEDLFRIWTCENSSEWYKEIALATNQLREDMDTMAKTEKKPSEFGIRVRHDCSQLGITSQNKMRNTNSETEQLYYWGGMFETPYLHSDFDIHQSNYDNFIKIIETLENNNNQISIIPNLAGKTKMIQDVNKQIIIDLLNKVDTSEHNNKFDRKQIINFIDSTFDDILDKWDIAFVEGSGDEINILENEIKCIKRNKCELGSYKDNTFIKVTTKGRLGVPTDGKIGLDSSINYNVLEKFEKEYNYHKKDGEVTPKTIPANCWFKYIEYRKPLLIVYLIDIDGSQKIQELKNNLNGTPLIGLAVGFPNNNNVSKENQMKYVVNSQYNYYDYDEIEEE